MDEMTYYPVDLPAEQIEEKLLYSVVCNRHQNLSPEQQAQFRENIGAGKDGKGLVILGYYDTLERLQEELTKIPDPGDAYGIGRVAPYDIYVYDAPHHEWVNNGPLTVDGAIIDDNVKSGGKTWSSVKIWTLTTIGFFDTLTPDVEDYIPFFRAGINYKCKLSDIPVAASAITGRISRSKLQPNCLYSPADTVYTTNYTISAADAGKTLVEATRQGLSARITLPKAASDLMPIGTEIGILRLTSAENVTIAFSELSAFVPGQDGYLSSPTVKITEKCCMVALKKITPVTWVILGNAEVVET